MVVDLRKLGVIGGALSIAFFLTFMILGFIQPGYNHVQNTVSELVLGRFGWIQSLNFVLLSISIGSIGVGLGLSLYKKMGNPISALFLVTALISLSAVFFPTDPSPEFASLTLMGKVHYLIALASLLFVAAMIVFVISRLSRSDEWRGFVPYSVFVLITNVIAGTIWFYLFSTGYSYGWEGLLQKLIIANVLIWQVVMGLKLSRLRLPQG